MKKSSARVRRKTRLSRIKVKPLTKKKISRAHRIRNRSRRKK